MKHDKQYHPEDHMLHGMDAPIMTGTEFIHFVNSCEDHPIDRFECNITMLDTDDIELFNQCLSDNHNRFFQGSTMWIRNHRTDNKEVAIGFIQYHNPPTHDDENNPPVYTDTIIENIILKPDDKHRCSSVLGPYHKISDNDALAWITLCYTKI